MDKINENKRDAIIPDKIQDKAGSPEALLEPKSSSSLPSKSTQALQIQENESAKDKTDTDLVAILNLKDLSASSSSSTTTTNTSLLFSSSPNLTSSDSVVSSEIGSSGIASSSTSNAQHYQQNNNINNSTSVTNLSSSCSTLSERKRKERHDSDGQEKKLTKSFSNEEGKESRNGKDSSFSDFRKSQSNENFTKQANNMTPNLTNCTEDNHPCRKEDKDLSTATTIKTSPGLSNIECVAREIESIRTGMIRNIPLNFEAEAQRELERRDKGRNRKIRKIHRSRSQLKNVTSREEENCSQNNNSAENSPNNKDKEMKEFEDLDSPTSTESSIDEVEENEIDDIHKNLNFDILHHNMNSEFHEPTRPFHNICSTDQAPCLSPRNSIVLEQFDIPPSPPLLHFMSRQTGSELRMDILTRQISNLKKQLHNYISKHEQIFGYKASRQEMLNNKEMRKCLHHLSKAKLELKMMHDEPSRLQRPVQRSQFDLGLDETVKEIERNIEKRPISSLNRFELAKEKSVMQHQLIMLEKRFGRPTSKPEKDIVRNLYERYRNLKKLVEKTNLKENNLMPIIEHQMLDIQDSTQEEGNCSIVEINDNINLTTRRIPTHLSSLDDGGHDESFNKMSLSELESRIKLTREDKRKLRSILKLYETDFQNATGRLPQKDEKYSSVEMENVYQKYKRRKSEIRLLEVLITKQKCPNLINKNED